MLTSYVQRITENKKKKQTNPDNLNESVCKHLCFAKNFPEIKD